MNMVVVAGTAHLAGAVHLADNDFGDDLGDGVAGPVGLLIIVLLSIATALLIRNMNKRLKRLPESFPDPVDAYNRTMPRTPEAGAGDPTHKDSTRQDPTRQEPVG